MEAMLGKFDSKEIVKSSIFDFLAVAFIYFVPVLSHLFAIPIYYLEPMRLMLILSITHTSKKNAYILALTLPIFSFAISAHPVFIKTLLISGELIFNVWLFFLITEKIKNKFAAMFLSIGISKIAYYALKFALLNLLLIEGSLVSTPIIIQFATMSLFSYYFYLLRK